MPHSLLVIREESSYSTALDAALGPAESHHCCIKADWRTFDPDALSEHSVSLVVPVAVPPNAKATAFFEWLRDHSLSTPTLAVVPTDMDSGLLETVSQTVDDFLVWPARPEECRQRVTRLLGSPDPSPALASLIEEVGMSRLVGRHADFVRAMEKLPSLARSGRPVLITGETGTGKEMCARAIHLLSSRRSFPFIPVDCAAFPEQLFENELFGHVHGAFTDAHADQKGLIALAEGGTLFLDEIDALSLGAQSKLLRFLEERIYRPLGAERFSRADVNVLAASNQDLGSLVHASRFRADLYFRLNVLSVHLVPLRERHGDVEILARRLLAGLCRDAGVGRKTLTPPAFHKLSLYQWPGNVRELLNVLQRAAVCAEGACILPGHLAIPSPDVGVEGASGGFRQARARAIEAFEEQYVRTLLQKHGGNVTRASHEAHKERRAFGRLIKKHSINRLDL